MVDLFVTNMPGARLGRRPPGSPSGSGIAGQASRPPTPPTDTPPTDITGTPSDRRHDRAGGRAADRLVDVADYLRVRGSVTIPRDEFSWRFSRSSGPGGQSVNTADSRVELSWDVARSRALSPTLRERALRRLAHRLVDGVLTVSASEHRAQLQNRRAAETRLAALLDEALAPPPPRRKPTRPSRAAVQARIDAKRRRGEVKRRRRSVEE